MTSPRFLQTANGFALGRGVNISHWLSQVSTSEETRPLLFREPDVAFLAAAGFDHLRLPVDEERLWDEDGRRIADGWRDLASALAWSARAGLRVVVDLHIVRSHHFNAHFQGRRNLLFSDPAAQDRFLEMWEELSAVLRPRPVAQVAYEVLNEAVADDPEDWNRVLGRALDLLRRREPERALVAGSNRWQQIGQMPFLRLPDGDPNLILSFHYYNPFLVTHYRASWTVLREYTGPVHYPGVPVRAEDLPEGLSEAFLGRWREGSHPQDAAVLEQEIEQAVREAEARHLPLYCGEFGCLPTVPRADRLRWYRDMAAILDRHRVARASWDYFGGFGLVDRATGEADQDLLAALTRSR